jgi:hypothetical protein
MTNLPKIAVLMSRGIEGGGVSNYVRHLKAYYDSKSAICDIYSPSFTKGRPLTSIDLFPYIFEEDSFKDFYRMLYPYDAVFVMGGVHKKMPDWYVNSYIEQLKKSKKPIILYNFDHHYVAYSTNARYGELLDIADSFLSYSTSECMSGIIRYMRRNNFIPPKNHRNLYNFFHNDLLKDYVKIDSRVKKIIHLTRSNLWKRPGLLANSHEEFADRGWVVEILGLERSINTATFFRKYGHKNFFRMKGFEPKACYPNPEKQYNIFKFLAPNIQKPDTIYLFGPYQYFDGMNRVAQSAFSFHPVTFEHNGADLGDCAEFIFLESCLLSVPIAQKYTLDRVKLPYTSTPLSDMEFIVQMEDDNAKYDGAGLGPRIIDVNKLIDRMEEIHSDSNYKKTRKQLVDFMNDVYSSEVLVPKLLSDVGL